MEGAGKADVKGRKNEKKKKDRLKATSHMEHKNTISPISQVQQQGNMIIFSRSNRDRKRDECYFFRIDTWVVHEMWSIQKSHLTVVPIRKQTLTLAPWLLTLLMYECA